MTPRSTVKSKADPKLKEAITGILKAEFPNDTVDVSDGYQDNMHIVVVSRKFDNKTQKARQDMIWKALDKSSLTDLEKSKISLIIPYSPAELK